MSVASRAFVVFVGSIVPLLAPAASTNRSVVIVTPDERDSRLLATREAIEFWNQTVEDLKLRLRFREARLLVAPPITRALENYTRDIWMLAGRAAPTGGGPRPPRELTGLEGDIIVFFSQQVIFSFARPFAAGRFFIGIQTDKTPPLTYPNVSRNVIAHELGHTLGLEHNGDTPTLMCGPCQHVLYRSDERRFFPLTTEEHSRLVELHPPE